MWRDGGSSAHSNQGHLYTQTQFICTHISGSSVHTYRVHLYTQNCLGMGWGGVGWANNVHVPVHTHTDTANLIIFLLCTHRHSKPYHLSSPADAGTFLGMGWGGVITFMFLCTHRHSNLIIFLAVLQTQALLLADQLPVGWGGVITFMFLCTHRHTNHLG